MLHRIISVVCFLPWSDTLSFQASAMIEMRRRPLSVKLAALSRHGYEDRGSGLARVWAGGRRWLSGEKNETFGKAK
ncbi:hypothetical protein Ddc_17844 [Ditylenchus destructor]|nr:hypothetical protein Ddc_17844 [Ditylenchus destructor]